jgi:hypothetical protein
VGEKTKEFEAKYAKEICTKYYGNTKERVLTHTGGSQTSWSEVTGQRWWEKYDGLQEQGEQS